MTVYQVYIKSFFDSNHDGIGDLKGIEEKLSYLHELGIHMIWITPFYKSPMYDNGYDVADYLSVDTVFGSMEDLQSLIHSAEKYGIGIMLDMVFNHSSTFHPWFQKAISGSEKYRDYYYFVKGDEEPTNWLSKFGGSAWEYSEELGMYYLHLFHKYQADLNWKNESMREELYQVVNKYLAMGVKGFRFDVVNLISKPDEFLKDDLGDGRRFYTDGPRIHEYLQDMNQKTFGKYSNIVTVGEMSSTSIESCKKYSHSSGRELSMVFNFHHLKVDYKDGDKWSLMKFDFLELKKLLFTWQLEMEKGDAWQALFWSNHDQPRIASRFGDFQNYHEESAKSLATALYFMRGTNYIYQGEEIGMLNPGFSSIEDYHDVESINYYRILQEKGIPEEKIMEILGSKSRDNSRTPMQWDDSEYAGFSAVKPWIAVGSSYKKINVEKQIKDANSILQYYKKIVAFNAEKDIFAYGSIAPILETHKSILGYYREYEGQKVLVLCNFFASEAELDYEEISLDVMSKKKVLLSNYDGLNLEGNNKVILRPYEAIVLEIE